MRIWETTLILAVLACGSRSACAQSYQDDPCSPQLATAIPFIGPAIAQQRAQACQRERQAIYAAQRQAEQAREAEQQAQQQAAAQRAAAFHAEQQAKIDAANRRAAAEAEQQAVIQAELAERRQAAVAKAETEAENSPNNFCRTPEVAKRLLDEFTSLEGTKALDITHLVTVRHDDDAKILSCHGDWQLSEGGEREGTLTFRPNVAGEAIVEWHSGPWSPPIPAAVESPSSVPATQAGIPGTAGQSDSFHRGLDARSAWEAWFDGLSSDYRDGANFWASQRSLAHPASCKTLHGAAIDGCAAAQARLALPDYFRKTDPEYRRGWNSYQADTPYQSATATK